MVQILWKFEGLHVCYHMEAAGTVGLRGIVCKNGAIYGHSESGVITLIRP